MAGCMHLMCACVWELSCASDRSTHVCAHGVGGRGMLDPSPVKRPLPATCRAFGTLPQQAQPSQAPPPLPSSQPHSALQLLPLWPPHPSQPSAPPVPPPPTRRPRPSTLPTLLPCCRRASRKMLGIRWTRPSPASRSGPGRDGCRQGGQAGMGAGTPRTLNPGQPRGQAGAQGHLWILKKFETLSSLEVRLASRQTRRMHPSWVHTPGCMPHSSAACTGGQGLCLPPASRSWANRGCSSPPPAHLPHHHPCCSAMASAAPPDLLLVS